MSKNLLPDKNVCVSALPNKVLLGAPTCYLAWARLLPGARLWGAQLRTLHFYRSRASNVPDPVLGLRMIRNRLFRSKSQSSFDDISKQRLTYILVCNDKCHRVQCFCIILRHCHHVIHFHVLMAVRLINIMVACSQIPRLVHGRGELLYFQTRLSGKQTAKGGVRLAARIHWGHAYD